MNNMEVCKSDIVMAVAGREKGKLFFVVEVSGGYAFLVDGKGRKLSSPKKKKLKHVKLCFKAKTPEVNIFAGDTKVTDREIRRSLAVYRASADKSGR